MPAYPRQALYVGRYLRHELPAQPVGLPGAWFEHTAADRKVARARLRAWTELLARSG